MSGNKQNNDLFLELVFSSLDRVVKILPKKNSDLKDQMIKKISIYIAFL